MISFNNVSLESASKTKSLTAKMFGAIIFGEQMFGGFFFYQITENFGK